MPRRPITLTRRPHLIVAEHGCAFELQNHREYGVTSCRAKGVHEKNLMVRNNVSPCEKGIFVARGHGVARPMKAMLCRGEFPATN
jgi:hypothetical protein